MFYSDIKFYLAQEVQRTREGCIHTRLERPVPSPGFPHIWCDSWVFTSSVFLSLWCLLAERKGNPSTHGTAVFAPSYQYTSVWQEAPLWMLSGTSFQKHYRILAVTEYKLVSRDFTFKTHQISRFADPFEWENIQKRTIVHVWCMKKSRRVQEVCT